MKLSPMLVKIDLKSVSSKLLSFPRFSRKETVDECWQIDLLTTNRIPSCTRISPMRDPLSGRLQTPELLLLGPVSLYGLRPTNLSRELARHRSLPTISTSEALSHGHPWSSVAQHSGPRQLGARLAHPRRLRAGADHPGQRTLSRRQFWCGPGADCLRARCDHHRFVPLAFSLGQVPQEKRRRGTNRSEEHTSELQSLRHLVCRLLLEKKKKQNMPAVDPP